MSPRPDPRTTLTLTEFLLGRSYLFDFVLRRLDLLHDWYGDHKRALPAGAGPMVACRLTERLAALQKSSGAPVVILADIACKLSLEDATRYLDPERRLCAMKIGGWSPLDLQQQNEREAKRDEAEGIRLAYVAATRAQDLLIVPALRGMNLYTLPDYFHVRFGGRWPRLLAAWAAIVCSFTYVVAQIYGIGLIASRLTGVQFEIGILLGLGGVLLCSFLGGMRAITWTQVAQCVIILAAYLRSEEHTSELQSH